MKNFSITNFIKEIVNLQKSKVCLIKMFAKQKNNLIIDIRVIISWVSDAQEKSSKHFKIYYKYNIFRYQILIKTRNINCKHQVLYIFENGRLILI